MSPQKAFGMFWGMKLHFSSLDYSVIKYGTNTKAAISKFDALSQEQRFRFEWLSKKYPETQDLVYACIGCEFEEINLQFATKEDITDAFFKFKSRRESMSYSLKSEISKYNDSDRPPLDKLIFKYLVGQHSPEFMLLLGYENDELSSLYNSPVLSWARPKILKIIKYTDFFNSKKYHQLLIETK